MDQNQSFTFKSEDLDFLITSGDLNQFLDSLDVISKFSFDVKVDIESKIRQVLSAKVSGALISLLQRNNISLSDPTQFQHLIENLKSELIKLPKVSLTLALEPKEDQLRAILNWFLYQHKKKVILEVHVNPNIIAGAIIEFEGIQKDYSLKKRLEEEYGGKDLLAV